jgi:predicted ATPase
MSVCFCKEVHHPHRVVLTGGPGAGKTAVLEVMRRSTCPHILVLPEAAGIVFGGGFPRSTTPHIRRAAQRAIFRVQRELEATATDGQHAIVLCDRGTVDGVAYWPGEDDFWQQFDTTSDQELARYQAVIHLRVPTEHDYTRSNPLRIESAVEASAIDLQIASTWSRHPRYFQVPASQDFLDKIATAVGLIMAELPECCRPSQLIPMA